MDLFNAVGVGNLGAVRAAIRGGEDVNRRGWNGDTPLIQAANYGHTGTVRELLSLGATVDLGIRFYVTDDGDTALIRAAWWGHTDTVKELLSLGATVDLANKDGNTALIQAALEGRTGTVRELLLSGATVDLANKEGKTALDIARRSFFSNSTVVDLLEAAAKAKGRHKPPPQSATVPSIKLPSQSAEVLPPKPPPQSAPILPRNWTAVTDSETETVVYVNKAKAEDKVSTPPGYPLHQTSTHPDVTFYDEPQQKKVTSNGGHFDFDNGVEVTVPPDTIKAGSSVNIKVQPSLAPKDVFVIPQGIQSASPSYLLSSEGADVNGEWTVIIEHHVRVATKEEANDLLFLQADSSPKRSGSKCTYEYQEVPESRSEFIPGENKGELTTKHFSRKFFKIGKKLISGRKPSGATKADDPPQTEEQQVPDSNLYTIKVYRSPLQTTGDRMAIICVCLFGRLYEKFLEKLDTELIPRDYPEVSIRVADRTTIGSLQFIDLCAKLNVLSLLVRGWTVDADKKTISKAEVDRPETEQYKPEDLHDYPPKIVCRFYPEEDAPKRATSVISFSGLQPDIEVSIPLKAPKVQAPAVTVVDTTKLQEAADKLRGTALQVSDSQLGSTVDSILSLIDRMTSALKSSSLGDLAVHTESIERKIKTVLTLARKIAEECTRQIIRDNIDVSLSKMEALSHQINQVTRVKLRHCQDQSEETAALEGLVESGADLLRTIDCLLKAMKTLSGFSRKATSLNKHNHLLAIKECIWDARVGWRNIGSSLKVPSDVLDEIAGDLHHRDDGQRLERVLVEWLHTGTATIHQLLRALQDRSIRRRDIAMEIQGRVGEERSAVGLCDTTCSICNS